MKKKILSLLTAFAMVFGILVAPFTTASANNADHPVTVPTGTLSADQLSAKKPETTEVDIYKLSTKENYKAGAPWEHTGGKIADVSQLGTGVAGIAKAKFTIYKINGKDDVENEKILALLEKNKSKFETVEDMSKLLTGGNGVTGLTASEKDATLTKITAGQLKKVDTGKTVTTDNNKTEADINNGETLETDANGLATVKLADGYYWFIESQKPDKVTGQIAVPFGLTLPLMNGKDVGNVKAGSQYLKKLYIYPKNIQTNEVQIDKNHAKYDTNNKKWYDKDGNEVSDDKLGADFAKYSTAKETVSAQLGKPVPYDSKTTIPRNYTFEEFSWSDIMSEGLTYNKGTLKVTMDYVDSEGTTQKAQQFIDLTAGTKVNAGLVTEKDNGFDIRVIKEGIAENPQPQSYTQSEKTAITNLISYLKNGPVTFYFSYSATVNNETVVDKPQSNSITFEPGKPDGGGKVKSSEDKITINKSWKKKGQNVDNPTATEITYYLLDENEKTVASVTVKNSDKNGKKYDAGKGITFTVGNKFGSGTFSGLEKGKTFTVREAVAGYKPDYKGQKNDNLPTGTLEIENNDKPEVKKPTEPNVVFHGKKFVKMDQMGDTTRLFGAEFVVKNNIKGDANNGKYLVVKSKETKIAEETTVKAKKEALDAKIKAYNELTAEEQKKQKATYETEINTLQKAYNDAVIASRTKFEWGAKADAYVLVSDGLGRFEITGLSAGKYQLEEITAPTGYALRQEAVDFEVRDGSYNKYAGSITQADKQPVHIGYDSSTDENKGQRVDNKKVTIPQTGGIGSLIFIVAGLAIMTGAFVAYKRSQAVEA